MQIQTDMLTQTESTTHSLAQSFLRRTMGVNWAQRRYELVKDIYCAKIGRPSNYQGKAELMDEAFKDADIIINRLKALL